MFKRQQNPLAGGNVDLTLDGGLNKDLFIRHMHGSIFNIFSSDEKAIMIAQKYGLENYNITPEETKAVLEEAKANIYNELFNWVFK